MEGLARPLGGERPLVRARPESARSSRKGTRRERRQAGSVEFVIDLAPWRNDRNPAAAALPLPSRAANTKLAHPRGSPPHRRRGRPRWPGLPMPRARRRWPRSTTSSSGRSLRRLGVAPQNVDDAAQKVFVLAAEKVAKVAPGSERPFLFQTAVRVAMSIRRTYGQRREAMIGEALDTIADPAPLPDAKADEMERREVPGRAARCVDDGPSYRLRSLRD
jgi:hypothetical protein